MAEAVGPAAPWRRHLPAGLYLATLCAVILAWLDLSPRSCSPMTESR